MLALATFVAGSAALMIADIYQLSPAMTLAAVIVGVVLVAYAASAAVYEFGRQAHGMYFPGDPPPGERATEAFTCLTPGGPPVADGVSSADAIAALSAGEATKKTYTDSRTCGPSLYSNPPTDSPAALTFDGLLLRALHAQAIPLLSASQQPECTAAPTEAQLSEFLRASIGRDVLMPSIDATVPVKVACMVVRGCRAIQSGTDETPRNLSHVEFMALRDGDSVAIHYEAQIVDSPMSLVFFKRLGQVPSGDATCAVGRRRTP